MRPMPRRLLRRNIPNLITSGNLLCGMMALLMAIKGHLNTACWLIPLSMVFDFCDGLAARALDVSSDFGGEFDSLGDVVSFGVAPAVLIYSAYEGALSEGVLFVLCLFFPLCGALRLARYNVSAHHPKGFFRGLPIPAAGLCMVGCVFVKDWLPPSVMAGLMATTGLLMVSSVPFGNLKGVTTTHANRQRLAALATFLVVTLSLARSAGFFVLMVLYVASGLFSFDLSGWLTKCKGGTGSDLESPNSEE